MRLAVNIENPADLSASVDWFHPTSQSIAFVTNVATAALEGGGAHALLGAFGVGKSSLAAFTLNELSCPTTSFEPKSRRHLFGAGRSSVAKVHKAGGLVPLPVVGASEPLASRVFVALRALANDSRLAEGTDLSSYRNLDSRDATGEQAMHMLIDAARAFRRRGRAGTILVIDEFGRHLEHMLAATADSDLHLLQSIAEATGRADVPLSLLIIQHFGLEHYGAMFRGARRKEWEKVRGRFSETVLNNTEIDAAHITAKIIDTIGFTRGKREPLPRPERCAPRILRDPEFRAAAKACYPLHPMTVVVLSRLARLLGQNDRTIVGWLTSNMDSGFLNMQRRQSDIWIYPDALYEHFFGDSLLVLSNPAFAKRYAAVQSAYERIDDNLSYDARVLFRTLGLLGFCSGRGINSGKASALACLPKGFPFERCINELTDRSLILYRRYRSEYVVWEGSDYDVTRRIDEEISASPLNVALEMNRQSRRTVLAHRHAIRTGNRRTAPVVWLNGEDKPPDSDGRPRVLIWMGNCTSRYTLPKDVVGVVSTSNAIAPHLHESAVIRQLLDGDGALQEDAVAMRELESLLAFHEEKITSLSQELLDSNLDWRVGETRFATMQEALSAAMDSTYPLAFVLHNDLVNQDRASGQVMFALRKLIGLLYAQPERENLGIEKFPAERIIYESLLKRKGLHTPNADGAWQLRINSGRSVPSDLAACVVAIRQRFAEAAPSTNSVEEIVGHLALPPYGVKRVPALLLCILTLLDLPDAHELYEGGEFLPRWGPDTLLRLLKTPKRFTIIAASASSVPSTFMRSYMEVLSPSSAPAKSLAPVALAREALRRHARLSIYAQRTTTVSPAAHAFRRALEVARSPSDMLFARVPDALGYPSLPTRSAERTRFLDALHTVWAELESADRALMVRLEQAAQDTLGCGSLDAVHACCRQLASQIALDGNLHHGYEKFLSCILDDTTSDSSSWIGYLAENGLGISTPVKSWTDEHASQGEFILRRSLMALQRVSSLLSERTVQEDATPFVVFWPNPSISLGARARLTAEEMVALANKLPSDERMLVIADVAQHSRRST